MRYRYWLLIAPFIILVIFFCMKSSVGNCVGIQPVTSWEIAGRTVVIDPGHGGSDPGTIGYNGTLEKDVALSVCKRLASLFRQAGAKVVMTRYKDDFSKDLAQRVNIANKAGADVLLSVHLNHFADRTEYGAQAFYQEGSFESKRLAELIQSKLNHFLVDSGRMALPGNFYICRNSKMPAVIIEVGFLSNPEEEKKLNDPACQTRAAWAIFLGVLDYFKE